MRASPSRTGRPSNARFSSGRPVDDIVPARDAAPHDGSLEVQVDVRRTGAEVDPERRTLRPIRAEHVLDDPSLLGDVLSQPVGGEKGADPGRSAGAAIRSMSSRMNSGCKNLGTNCRTASYRARTAMSARAPRHRPAARHQAIVPPIRSMMEVDRPIRPGDQRLVQHAAEAAARSPSVAGRSHASLPITRCPKPRLRSEPHRVDGGGVSGGLPVY